MYLEAFSEKWVTESRRERQAARGSRSRSEQQKGSKGCVSNLCNVPFTVIRSNFLLSAIRYLFRSTRDGRRDRDARNDVFTNWPFNGQKLTAPLKEFIAHSRRKKGNNTAFLLHYSFEQMGKNVLKSISHFFDFFLSFSALPFVLLANCTKLF